MFAGVLSHPGNACASGRRKQEKEVAGVVLPRVLLTGDQLEAKQVSLEVLGCLLFLSCDVTRVCLPAGPRSRACGVLSQVSSPNPKVPGTEPHH